MRLQFMLERIMQDLEVVPSTFVGNLGGDVVKLDDVQKVLERWYNALETEETLKYGEQRLQDILNKEGKITMTEFNEAFELVMLIHMPLISGRNDVMGVRLRDADLYRLKNKMVGLPPDSGLDEYNDKVQGLADEEQRLKDIEKNKRVEKSRRTREANKQKKEAELAEIAKQVQESLQQQSE